MARYRSMAANITGIILALGLLASGCVSLGGNPTTRNSGDDPYAKNPAEWDPRAHPLTKRDGPATDPAAVVAEFKALKRPIIERYVKYSGQTLAEARLGENPEYTHIVLTDEACTFINHHTFDELAMGLGPVLSDPYWNGDVVAVIGVATTNLRYIGGWLCRVNYHSPDDSGQWPHRIQKYPGDTSWLVTYYGATVKLNLYDGTLTPMTLEEIKDNRRRMEAARKSGRLR